MATWRDLTFTFGAYLTSSQLNQLQGNFPSVAQNDDADSAPRFKAGACQDWTVEASARNTSLGAGATWTPTHGPHPGVLMVQPKSSSVSMTPARSACR